MDGVLYVPLSQHHGTLAAVPQPADLGRLCGFDLWHGLSGVLVRGPNSGLGDTERSRCQEAPENHLRHAVDGLAGLGAPLASLPVGVFAARRTRHAAGSLRAHRREL